MANRLAEARQGHSAFACKAPSSWSAGNDATPVKDGEHGHERISDYLHQRRGGGDRSLDAGSCPSHRRRGGRRKWLVRSGCRQRRVADGTRDRAVAASPVSWQRPPGLFLSRQISSKASATALRTSSFSCEVLAGEGWNSVSTSLSPPTFRLSVKRPVLRGVPPATTTRPSSPVRPWATCCWRWPRPTPDASSSALRAPPRRRRGPDGGEPSSCDQRG